MEDIKLIFESETYVVISKPSGMLSVPGRGPEKADCAVKRFKDRYPDAIVQPAIHRLDMATSGLLVMARTKETHRDISIQFQDRAVKKRYTALIEGHVEEESGVIKLPFRLDVDNRPYQIYDEQYGKWGTTEWKRLGYEGDLTRVEFTPLTGRTHQLRVHSAHEKGLGFPIVGDFLYGNGTDTNQLKLHAQYLGFTSPDSGEWVEFSVDVPF